MENFNSELVKIYKKKKNIKENENENAPIIDIYDELKVLQNFRNNFAINYHRKLRDKNMTKSVLDDVKGLGVVRKKLLLEKFGSIENIKNSRHTNNP